MIVRDSRSPKGRYEEQPRSPFTLAAGLAALLDEPYSWRDSDETFARRVLERETKRETKAARIVVATTRIARQVLCQAPNCNVVFTTENPRRLYCSTTCTNRAWRQHAWAKAHEGEVAKSRAKGIRATCHPDRPHVARGLCRPCYNADWLRRQARLSV